MLGLVSGYEGAGVAWVHGRSSEFGLECGWVMDGSAASGGGSTRRDEAGRLVEDSRQAWRDAVSGSCVLLVL